MIDWHLAAEYFGWAMLNLALSGFLGGSETAFLSLNRIFLYARQESGALSSKILIFLVERSTLFVTAIVIANNVTLILGTLYITRILIEVFHISLLWTTILGAIITTPFQLIIGEVLPKSFFHPFSNLLSYKFAFIWIIIYFALLPLSLFFRGILFVLSKIFGVSSKDEQGFAQSEFQDLLDVSLKSGALNTGEREFINNILEFRDIRAREAMTPLSQLVCVEQSETVQRTLDIMKEKQVSILPVYHSRIDNPIGRVRAKDLLTAMPNEPVLNYVQEVFFIPATAHLEKVLIQMQRRHLPLAFVVDEYGGIVGVLRVEDIVVEIVGEVIEEGEIDFLINPDGSVLADGLCDIDDLFGILKLTINTDEVKTLGGFIMEKLGRMPRVGDIIFDKPWYFFVQSLRGRSIERVMISKNKPKSHIQNESENGF